MVRILHLLQSNRFSGAENVVCQIINMMKNEPNIEMFYCSRNGAICDALKERNVNFVSINDLSVSEIKRVIKELKPDMIHAHDMRAAFYAAVACGKIPLISHIHGNHFNSRMISIKSILFIYAGIKSQEILWVSKSAYDGYVFKEIFKNKSHVLYNIIDTMALHERAENAEVNASYDVVYIGRLSYPKNPQRLICILKGLLQKNNTLKFAIVGSGELENEVKDLCSKYGMECNVDFLGFVHNPLGILKHSKVMIMTSRYEGTPMVALEAMALGVPIVSTPTDGMNELIKNNVNGYLTDNNLEMINYLNDILTNDELRQNMSIEQINTSLIINNVEKYKEYIHNIYKRNV